MLFLLADSLQKLKLKNIHDTTKTVLFLLKTQKKTSTVAVGSQYLKVEVAD